LCLINNVYYRVIAKIKAIGYPVTLALDGWTNVAHNKVTNLILLCDGRAFYWCSVVNHLEHNTAGIFIQQLKLFLTLFFEIHAYEHVIYSLGKHAIHSRA
jgi:hypothetical protein